MNVVEYLIVGNGVAGITAAQEIRRADPDGRIVIVSDEGEPYYYRASMSEWLSGQTSDEMLPGRSAEFYRHMRLEQLPGHVVRVDPEAHQVHLEEGTPIGYRKLLIASGARANTFPVKGLGEILVFRSLSDVRTIRERIGCCGRALILGGGVLGLELAGALHKMGIEHIAVVQRSGYVGKPLLDARAAAWLQARMLADGVDLFVNDTVAGVDGRTARFRSGRTWDLDILVQAVGITPVFPEVPGLAVGKGVRIDAYGRTNLPDLYAAGDCAETRKPGSDRWQATRIWLDCALQGKTAGCTMAADLRGGGGSETLLDRPFFNASILYTVLYAYIGDPHGEDGQVYLWQEGEGYRQFRVVDGRLAGALLLGERRGSMAILNAIGQLVAAFGADIACPSFPWNDLTGQDWDYLFY